MKHRKFVLGIGLAGTAIVGMVHLNNAFADTGNGNEPHSSVQITLRNVSPRMMAWWLDPAHNPKPLEIVQSEQNQQLLAGGVISPPEERDNVKLPLGVDSIVAVDPQNALLVYGTTAGIAQLKTRMAALDKPLRQVEIETQFVEINRADAQALGIREALATPDGINLVPDNYRAALHALLQQNKAKVITAHRVTAINNLTAMISIGVTTPVLISIGDRGSKTNADSARPGTIKTKLDLEAQSSFAVTPTINQDETMTLRVVSLLHYALRNGNSASSLPLDIDLNRPGNSPKPAISFRAKCRDGETMALSNLDAQVLFAIQQNMINRLNGSTAPAANPLPASANSERELIALITPRLVRRADDFTDNRNEEQRKDPLFLPDPISRKSKTQSPVQP